MSQAPAPDPLAPSSVGGNRRGRRRREALLAAVADYLVDEGVDGFSLRRAAERVGASHRILLYHFGSGPELLRAALAEIRRRMLARLDEPAPPAADLDHLAIRFITDRSAEARALIQGLTLAVVDPDRYGAISEDWIAAYLPRLEAALPQGLDPELRDELTALALCTLRGALIDYHSTGDATRATRAVKRLLAMVDEL